MYREDFMGIFDKIKKIIKKEDNKKEEVELYDKGLEKTRKEFVSKLNILGLKYNKVNNEYFDELEELLIMADIGVNTVMNFIERLKARVKKENITDTKYLNEVIVDELFIIYVEGQSLSDKINMASEGPTVILLVGVNGVGKTTTIGKLAYKYKNEGKKVMLIAGDTFRAAAIEQLSLWGERLKIPVISSKQGHDPSAVAFDTITSAVAKNLDCVIIDTAGRLHNQSNLQNELQKIVRICNKAKEGAPHRKILILDGTQGTSSLDQAKIFSQTLGGVDGVIITKLDGTSKGGAIFSIIHTLRVPILYIGVGEGAEDLIEFDESQYIQTILDSIFE